MKHLNRVSVSKAQHVCTEDPEGVLSEGLVYALVNDPFGCALSTLLTGIFDPISIIPGKKNQ